MLRRCDSLLSRASRFSPTKALFATQKRGSESAACALVARRTSRSLAVALCMLQQLFSIVVVYFASFSLKTRSIRLSRQFKYYIYNPFDSGLKTQIALNRFQILLQCVSIWNWFCSARYCLFAASLRKNPVMNASSYQCFLYVVFLIFPIHRTFYFKT